MWKVVSCQLPEEEFNRLENLAKDLNLTRNKLLVGMVKDYLKQMEDAIAADATPGVITEEPTSTVIVPTIKESSRKAMSVYLGYKKEEAQAYKDAKCPRCGRAASFIDGQRGCESCQLPF